HKKANRYHQGFSTFERTGDIYSLFYEKGIQLLKINGLLTFITSNKWMRAGYGKSTRNFFCQHNPLKLIDLGSGIFESATVDTNILIIQKCASKPDNYEVKALDISKEKNISSFESFDNRWVTLTQLSNDSWTIASDIEQGIKAKIERIGKPLREWDIQINYGIKTGFNEAFIIDGKKKDELIAQDPKSAEIIKPILRGRDIKRYKAEFADLWLINSHNGIKGKLPKVNVVKDYPAIYKHLQQYEKQLVKRQDQGDHWTNLRNCAYIQEFEKEKIIYPNMTLYLPFIFNDKGYFINDKGYILSSDYFTLKFLVGYLNSKIAHRWIRKNCPELQGGTRELRKIFFENIPVPHLSNPLQQPFIDLVDKVLEGKENGLDTTALEQQIDLMVYRLYELTYEEVKVIDPEFKLIKEAYERIQME
ncbi:MAG TPA: restriction endonuclease, partial [Saprospirales bacterium]|nr:restriction endonuclease [Saprospirales bacterium]